MYNAIYNISGCGAVWLAQMLWEHKVAGSNPATPTIFMHINFIRSLATGKSKAKLIELSKLTQSFCGVDLFVAYKSNFKNDGYFVEFGAGDGIKASNTYILEKGLNWKGLLIEPARSFHEVLKNNRSCNIDYSCIAKESGNKVWFMEEDEEHKLYSHVFGYSGSNNFKYVDKYILETKSLNDVLDQYNAPHHIDFVSVDTKGGEYEILKSFDFSKRCVDIFCVDWTYSHNRNNTEMLDIATFFRDNNYTQFVHKQHEGWFVRNKRD